MFRVRRGRPAAASRTPATSPTAASPPWSSSPRAWGRPVLIEGPAGVGQDRAGQDARRDHRAAAHPPAVLRGARRGQGALRVEVRQAAPLHAAPARADRRADRRRARRCPTRSPRISGQDDAFFSHRFLAPRPLLQAIESGGSGGAAGRRDRQGRAGVRGVPARGPVRLPGLGAGARDHQGHAHPAGGAHLEQRARAVATASSGGACHLFIDFPPAGRGAGDHPAQGAGGLRAPGPDGGRRRCSSIRGLELRKAPSVSESLDWARSLVILNADALDRDLVESTLTMLVKHEKDLERVQGRPRQGAGRPGAGQHERRWTGRPSPSSASCGFPSPRIRLPELGPSGPVFIEGGRCVSGALGEYTKLWISAAGPLALLLRASDAARLLPAPPCRRRCRTSFTPGEMTVETFRQGLVLQGRARPALRGGAGAGAAPGGRRYRRDARATEQRRGSRRRGPLGWKLKMTHLIVPAAPSTALIRLEDGRLHPISRDGSEDVFKSSWVTYSDDRSRRR